MELRTLSFSAPPPVGDISNDCLTAFMDMNMLNDNLLVSAITVLSQGFHLACEGPHELVDSALVDVEALNRVGRQHEPLMAESSDMDGCHLNG